MNALITAANSAQAQQLKKILGPDDVILGDYQDIPELMVTAGRMVKTPNPRSAAFVHQMLSLCLDKQISKVYALRRDELLPLAQARQLFEEFDITLIIPSTELIDNNPPPQTLTGDIVILESGRVVVGDFLNAVALLHNKTTNGVFKVNNENYIIFTAD
ncbi:hypothetical protein BDD43_5715 [Mucilaginibacter gracilis]|uniref:Uncharacterized protein n=2 Tax=Mucilaginibacter gracilis TaxID=423350 RepID=A0A495JAL5_9SPHI|nr:hypothetical protein BDD43_5715 [Mucilaginibacter gracilis]